MSALTESARGQTCTLRIVGVCNFNRETVVLCHLSEFGGGKSFKAPDIAAVYGCSSCHDVLDGRVQHAGFQEERYWYTTRALIETHQSMHERGLLR